MLHFALAVCPSCDVEGLEAGLKGREVLTECLSQWPATSRDGAATAWNVGETQLGMERPYLYHAIQIHTNTIACIYIYIIVYLLVGAYILHTHILIIFHTFHCILYSGFILSFGCSQAPTAPTVTNAV